MGVSGLKWCDFCVWTEIDFFQQRIYFDESFWKEMLAKLTKILF